MLVDKLHDIFNFPPYSCYFKKLQNTKPGVVNCLLDHMDVLIFKLKIHAQMIISSPNPYFCLNFFNNLENIIFKGSGLITKNICFTTLNSFRKIMDVRI